MRVISRNLVLAILGVAVLAGSTAAKALPRRATLQGGECRCVCVVPNIVSGTVEGLANKFGSCSVYNSRTCNIEDSNSGGIRSGRTQECCQVQDNNSCRASTSGAIIVSQPTHVTATLAPTTTTPTSPTLTPSTTTGTTPITKTPQ
jgi:hypothetical protein